MVGLVAADSGSVDARRVPGSVTCRRGGQLERPDRRRERLLRRRLLRPFPGGGAQALGNAPRESALDARDRLAGKTVGWGCVRSSASFGDAATRTPHPRRAGHRRSTRSSRVELWRLIRQQWDRGGDDHHVPRRNRTGRLGAGVGPGQSLLSGSPDEVIASCPGLWSRPTPRSPRLAWRSGEHFREWWPMAPRMADVPALTLEDVSIVASLREAVS